MVVDDERVNVVLLERILEQDGYRNVKSVTDPSEAIGLYDQFEPDLVLLDLHMPKLDRFAVMKQLEGRISSDSFLPILILTADIRPEIKRAGPVGRGQGLRHQAVRPHRGAAADPEPAGDPLPAPAHASRPGPGGAGDLTWNSTCGAATATPSTPC